MGLSLGLVRTRRRFRWAVGCCYRFIEANAAVYLADGACNTRHRFWRSLECVERSVIGFAASDNDARYYKDRTKPGRNGGASQKPTIRVAARQVDRDQDRSNTGNQCG